METAFDNQKGFPRNQSWSIRQWPVKRTLKPGELMMMWGDLKVLRHLLVIKRDFQEIKISPIDNGQ